MWEESWNVSRKLKCEEKVEFANSAKNLGIIIDENLNMIQYLNENVGAVFKMLWQVLPLSTVQLVAERTKDLNSDDLQWVQDLTYQRWIIIYTLASW